VERFAMDAVSGVEDGAAAAMERAIELGREGMQAMRGGPFGAVVVAGNGTIVGEGCNRVTSTNDPTAHAEVTAIRAACAALGTFLLDGCTLYTSCEPCPMCLAAAYWAHVERIVYGATRADAAAAGFDDALIYEEIGCPPEGRRIPMLRLAGERGAALFDEWMALADRTAY
jgi:tRNA(Arg) A34 adenosine deaminase TadA